MVCEHRALPSMLISLCCPCPCRLSCVLVSPTQSSVVVTAAVNIDGVIKHNLIRSSHTTTSHINLTHQPKPHIKTKATVTAPAASIPPFTEQNGILSNQLGRARALHLPHHTGDHGRSAGLQTRAQLRTKGDPAMAE